ncbi:three-finger toxin A2-like [Trichomycterus rosablanca]|uniref:three-finger toxin A2-like n=1 Tax=Trichomycterus rosablanca TaxID=2290929 RepID=UPI002F358F03
MKLLLVTGSFPAFGGGIMKLLLVTLVLSLHVVGGSALQCYRCGGFQYPCVAETCNNGDICMKTPQLPYSGAILMKCASIIECRLGRENICCQTDFCNS